MHKFTSRAYDSNFPTLFLAIDPLNPKNQFFQHFSPTMNPLRSLQYINSLLVPTIQISLHSSPQLILSIRKINISKIFHPQLISSIFPRNLRPLVLLSTGPMQARRVSSIHSNWKARSRMTVERVRDWSFSYDFTGRIGARSSRVITRGPVIWLVVFSRVPRCYCRGFRLVASAFQASRELLIRDLHKMLVAQFSSIFLPASSLLSFENSRRISAPVSHRSLLPASQRGRHFTESLNYVPPTGRLLATRRGSTRTPSGYRFAPVREYYF